MLTTSLILSILGGLALAVPSQSQNLALRSLLRRQDLIDPALIPGECEGPCTLMSEALNSCGTVDSPSPECACNPTIMGHVDTCFACFVENNPELGEAMQQTQQTYEETCANGDVADSTAVVPASPTATTESAISSTTAADDATVTTSNSSTGEASESDTSEPDTNTNTDSESDNSTQDDVETNGAFPLNASLFVTPGALALIGLLF